MSSLSVAMIVRDEQEVLPVTLESLTPLLPVLSDIVIVDENSVDGTLDVIGEFSRRGFPISIRQRRLDTFSNQKNYALSLCKGDWVLGLDADMVVNTLTFNERLGSDYFNAFDVWDFALLYARGDLRHYCTASSSGMPTTRLWKNHKGLRYVRDIHEFLAYAPSEAWSSIHNPIAMRNTDEIVVIETSMLKSDEGVRERVRRYQRWADSSAKAGIPIDAMRRNAEDLISHRWSGVEPIPEGILSGIPSACFDYPLAKGFPRA
jgi:glycosyltransferase involved in cell wall biosynthesis